MFLLFPECIDEEMFYNFYEEILPDSPIGILRTPDLELLSNDNDSMIPRPKLGWPIRKVTFGKWKIFISVWTITYKIKTLEFQVMKFLDCCPIEGQAEL